VGGGNNVNDFSENQFIEFRVVLTAHCAPI